MSASEVEAHQKHMERALALARSGEGRVEPNPLVGAVLVKNGRVIGEGFHEYFGGPHAEINALSHAQEDPRDATLYVTIEPCAHQGKTPPCADAIIQAGIKQVVLAIRDPNPITDGRGVATLQKAGIEVIEGVCEREARQLNAPFFKFYLEGLPYFIAKWAMTIDGKIATSTGESKWISSDDSRMFLRQVRSQVSAVMVGIETVLKDDPALLGRAGSNLNPRRIILDSFARIPLDSRIIKTLEENPETYIIVSPNAPQDKVKKLWEVKCKIIEIEEVGGRLNFIKLARKLVETGINKVMIEGGGEVLASAFESDLVDEVMVWIAPKIIGGKAAKTPVAGHGIEKMVDIINLEEMTYQNIGPDLLLKARVRRRR